MRPFSLHRAADLGEALARAGKGAAVVAGGTDLLQLMREGVSRPEALVAIGHLGPSGVTRAIDGFRIGAMTTLAAVAADPVVRERLPAVAEAIEATASPQVRNMATVGGNLMQRTRCLYFRDPALPCNKRRPGSGCPALDGRNRLNAILGGSEACIATHASDLAVALVALDAEVVVQGPQAERTKRLEDFYLLPGETPDRETDLGPGELITSVWLPLEAAGLRMRYLKVRDRASFEWALVSVAVAIGFDGEQVFAARLAAGGVATRPWRLRASEATLVGTRLEDAAIDRAAERAVEGAVPRGDNAFKVPMLKAAVARALREVRP